MRGMGDQVVRIPLDLLHSILTGNKVESNGWHLPRSVDIIGVIDPVNERNPWVPDNRYDYDGHVFLRIQHKYCMRRPKGSQLMIEDYTAFLERFRRMAQEESVGV